MLRAHCGDWFRAYAGGGELGGIGAEIVRAEQSLERHYEAVEQGKLAPDRCEDGLTRLQARLDDLHAHKPNSNAKRRTRQTARPRRPTSARSPNSSKTSKTSSPDERQAQNAKALLPLPTDELRVNGRPEILPTYRVVPAVCAMSEKVEAAGIEPASADVPVRASTSIGRRLVSRAGRLATDLPTN